MYVDVLCETTSPYFIYRTLGKEEQSENQLFCMDDEKKTLKEKHKTKTIKNSVKQA